jgi:hypothetical protein
MKKRMYVIVKHIKLDENKKRVPVILLDGHGEIWEFDTEKEADDMRKVFELNSDSGHTYEVKKLH